MHMRPFEIGLIGVFSVVAIVGILFLALFQTRPSDDELLYGDRVTIWGTLSAAEMNQFLLGASQDISALQVVNYTYVDPRSFENTFVNAIAEGRSPDLIVIPHTMLALLRTKLTPISTETIPVRAFRDSYIDGAEIFLRGDGVYGIPFAVDPLVMYWNRDVFSSGGLTQPPRTWEALVSQTVPTLTRKNTSAEILQSAVAFGEYTNVLHAKRILSLLLLQTGSSIVNEESGRYRVTIADKPSGALAYGDAVFSFYTQFATPSRETYSWNRSKPLDRSAFIGGTLALYFGLGSEWRTIDRENPNLNYDVARVPQGSDATALRTYGDFYAFAIPRASGRAQGAFAVASLFSSPAYAEKLSDAYNFAPVHRALLATTPPDPIAEVLYQSAVVARGWLDPNPQRSDEVFRSAIENILSGGTRAQGVLTDTVQLLENLF